MSTPIPEFRPGTRILGQNTTGPVQIGWILSKGTPAGRANIALMLEADATTVRVANATYVEEGGTLPTGVAAFKINFANP